MKQLPRWALMIPVLLLAALLVSRDLDSQGLWFDEVWTYIVAGGAEYGPMTPAQVWDKVNSTDPIQGAGYPLLLNAWGGMTGWSEFAARSLSLLTGLITLALIYRIGRDMVNAETGLCAALSLSVTALFLHYLHEARAFSLLMLAGSLAVWSYWRLMSAARFRPLFAILLTLGGAGLLYSHYYGLVLLAALALVHLLLIPKNRAWLRSIIPAIVTGVLFLPALAGFLDGYNRFSTGGIGVIDNTVLSAGELLQKLIYYAGNGAPVLTLILLALGVLATFAPGKDKTGMRVLLALSIFVGVILVLLNAVLHLMDASRLRYTLLLWIPLAGVLGAGMVYTRRWHRYLPQVLAALWLIQGLITAATPAFLHEIEVGVRLRWRTMTDVLQRDGLPDDVFVFYIGDFGWDSTFVFDHAVHDLPFPAFTTLSLTSDENREAAYAKLNGARRVWFGVDTSKPDSPVYESVVGILQDKFVQCRELPQRDGLALALYASDEVFCPATPPQMQFGSGITLRTNAQFDQATGQLTVDVGAALAADVPPDTYSVAMHVMDAGDNLMAQTDAPLPNRNFGTLQLSLALHDLNPGDYTVYLLVYDWRSGQRLPATNLDSGEAGDRLAVKSIVLQ